MIKNMLLAVDIGNSETTLGVFQDDELKATWHIATVISRTVDEYASLLLGMLVNKKLRIADIKEVSMCSVVPPLTATFEEVFKRYFNVSPLVVTAGVKTGVRICMDNPKEVGADRIVDAAAAHHLYGGPVIIVDMGTATTFDTVSAKGDYKGGAIAPGMAAAAESMFTPRGDASPCGTGASGAYHRHEHNRRYEIRHHLRLRGAGGRAGHPHPERNGRKGKGCRHRRAGAPDS